jgi:hypothetical protein
MINPDGEPAGCLSFSKGVHLPSQVSVRPYPSLSIRSGPFFGSSPFRHAADLFEAQPPFDPDPPSAGV